MLPANRHLLPVIGIDIHMIIILGAPVPVPHPFIGLVFDPMDWIPKVGSTVNVNSIPRANSGTNGMLGTKAHIPMGGPFALAPTIGHESMNFFGSPRVKAEGSYFSGAGFMVMSCNDIGVPLSVTPGKKFKPIPSLYLPTSATIPIPGGKPVIVGGPYVPDLMGMLMGLVMSFGFGALMKIGGKALKKALTALNHGVLKKFKCTKGLSKKFCKHGFEPVNLITGSVLYEGCDFEIPGPIPIRWERNWYSDSGYQGLLGHGTHLCYEQVLEVFEEDRMIGLILPDGRSVGFPLLLEENESFYHRPEKLTLRCINRNNYELFDHNSQLTYLFQNQFAKTYKLESITNVSGLSIRLHYNDHYCLNRITDTAGRNIFLHLDDLNRIVKVEAKHKGSRRIYVEYGYNEAGDLSSITDANRKTTCIEYSLHLMVKKTDRHGHAFYWEYDGYSTGSRCIHTYGDGGILEGRIEYYEGYNIVTNSLGESTTYYFDENGLCIKETDPLGHSIIHEYTDFIELYRDIDEEGNITGFVYDDRGNMTAVQKPDGAVVRYLYDEAGRIKMVTDAEGNNTVRVYKNSNLKAIVTPDNSVTQYDYYLTGLTKNIKNNKGQVSQFEYDDDYNLVYMLLPGGAECSWGYDSWGRCLKASNPENQSQQFMYDSLDRLIWIRNFDGNEINYQYNAYDGVIYEKDYHHQIFFEYSPLGSIISKEENGNRLQYNYDTEERLVSLVNEHHEIYKFKYDSRGCIISETGFDGLYRQFIRDKAGKIIKINRPGGKFTIYEYDGDGKITRIEYSDGYWELYAYNKNGKLLEAINECSQISFLRDPSGRVIRETQGEHFVISLFDDLGRRNQVNSSIGASFAMEHNDAGQVSEMKAAFSDGTQWQAQYYFNNSGQERKRNLPGSIVSAFEYDRSGHPSLHKIRKRERITRFCSYSWNLNDKLQLTQNVLTTGTVQYGYDDFGALMSAKYEDSMVNFRVQDETKNLYSSINKRDRIYGKGGRLLENEGVRYSYDSEGNLLSRELAVGERWIYEWLGNGMLHKVIRPDGCEVLFEYDALGRRTSKTFKGMITRWLWDGNTPIHEWKYNVQDRPKSIIQENGEIIKNPEPLDQAITWIFDEGSFKPAAKLAASEVTSIITDYLGTPVEMYKNDGDLVWHVNYDIYGKIKKQFEGNLSDCPFRYQGQYEDVETGLYYNRFRYYDPADGCYISNDPVGLEGGLRFYSYVQNPNWWIDVFGLTGTYFFTDGKTSYIGKGPRDRMKDSMRDRIKGKDNATQWAHRDFGNNDTGLMVEAELMERHKAKGDPKFANAIESPGKAKLEALKISDPKAHADILKKADDIEADFKLSKGVKCV